MQCLTAGQCALRAMVDLALHSDQGPVQCGDIAKRQQLSEQRLSELLHKLQQAELVRAVEGSGCSYSLARDAAQISVRDVRLAVEDMLDPTLCADEKHGAVCQFMDQCPSDWLSGQGRQSVHEIWDSVTLADLCVRSAELDPHADRAKNPTGEFASSESKAVRDKHFSAFDSLEAAYAFQQSVVDGMAEPIMVIGTDYRIRLMNQAAREFSSSGIDASDPMLCYQVSHRRETPCHGDAHPCPLRKVLESGQPVIVVHEHYQASGERRLVELIASPLWGADGECHGIIESARDITERVQAEKALQRYTVRLRALAEQLAEVAEAERKRLARELHDQVGQNLTALGINLNIIQTQIPEEIIPAVRSRLDDSLLLVQQTTERIRNVMAELRPPVLDDYGLMSALHWYAEQFTQRTDIAVVVEDDGSIPRLDSRVETALFRITQEALTNVAKHSHASNVTVTVEADDKTLRLLVSDDGVGFDTIHLAELGRGRGWGLLTMTERAEAVGGLCLIESLPGMGTQVVVEVAR